MSGLPPGTVLVTGNPGKLAEAQRICGPDLESVALELPEIQSLDLEEVLRAKAETAWRALQCPLIVEETGFEIDALNGFPGPLVKWLLEAVGADGVAGLGHALGNPAATARCALLYRDAERSVLGEGTVEGRLVLPPRGGAGFGWDPVFVADGESRTFAELSGDEKDALGHRGRAWRALVESLS